MSYWLLWPKIGPQWMFQQPEVYTSASVSFHFHFLHLPPVHRSSWRRKEQINFHWRFSSGFFFSVVLLILFLSSVDFSFFPFHLSSCWACLSVSRIDFWSCSLTAPHSQWLTPRCFGVKSAVFQLVCVSRVCVRETERDTKSDGYTEDWYLLLF